VYFVTLCVAERRPLFGAVVNGKRSRFTVHGFSDFLDAFAIFFSNSYGLKPTFFHVFTAGTLKVER